MDPFLTEQQIEELVNFDYIEQDLSDLIEEQNDFNMNEYLNSNYDRDWERIHKSGAYINRTL